MGKVTALKMDTITKSSGHQMTGMAVSVCLTPAAPSPLPIPYPTVGTVAEGITDSCMRTKFGGAIVMTVGSCMSACHGNEPGTLKEVVSLNTAGPCFPALGAPIVLVELGMAGITGSIGQMNKSVTPGAGGSAGGAGGGAGGGGGGGGGGSGPGGPGTEGPSGGGSGDGGESEGAAPPEPPAPPSADGQATAGHPVDVITGALVTSPVCDFLLTGFLPLAFSRHYSTAAVRHQAGLGWGWTHDLDYRAKRVGDVLELTTPGGRTVRTHLPADDEVVLLPFGMRLSRLSDNLVIQKNDGLYRILGPIGEGRYLLAQIRDAHHNVVEVCWDDGELAGLVDPVGRTAVLVREGRFTRWEITAHDKGGQPHTYRAVSYEIDEQGDLVRVIDAGGGEIRYRYDEQHYLIREELPDGLVYHFVYDDVAGEHRCVETWGELPGRDVFAELGGVAPAGARGIYHARLGYEPSSKTTTVVDALGQRHVYRGNALGLVEQYTDPRGYTRSYTYDPSGNMILARDGGGRLTRQSFDAAGRLVGLTRPDGAQWRDRWDEADRVVQRVRPDGQRLQCVYDHGVLAERVDAEGRATSMKRDDRGQLVAATVPGVGALQVEYDAHGNVKRVTYPTGAVAEYEFDLFGCPVEVRSAQGVVYGFQYDSRQDLVRIEEPEGKVTEFGLDASRRVVAREDAGGLTTFRYVAGALVESVRRDGLRWRFGYDGLLRLCWIENPAGERYVRAYDGSGNVVRETSFAGVTTEFERDGSGYVVRVQRGDGVWERRELDGEGRIREWEHSDGLLEHYEYDAMGALVRARNANSAVQLERDDEGRVVREVIEAGGFAYSVDRRFDEGGRIVERKYGSGWSVEIDRREGDGAVEALRARAADGEALSFEHDPQGRELRRSRSDGSGVRFERDPYGLPVLISVDGSDGEEQRARRYQWSRLGPLEGIVDSRLGGRRYELDPEGRPLSANGLGAGDQYAVTPQGTSVPAEGGWSTGAGGRPVVTADERLSWDDRGRLARRDRPGGGGSWTYGYDGRNRLVSATGDGQSIRFAYDPLGRCLSQTYGDGSSTWFGWDGDSLVEERPTGGTVTQRVFDDDGYSPLLEARDGQDWRLAVSDAAGTPWLFLHADGSESELELGPWGQECRTSGDPGSLRFAGQRAESVTGLSYQRHRWYDPRLHVFLTPDPLGVMASVQDVGFVPNVTIYVDPLGLTTIVVGAPGDQVITNNLAAIQQQYPNATVVNQQDLRPGSLAGEDHVILQTHGAPGVLEWGDGNYANGQRVSTDLAAAGFRGGAGSQVDVYACNGATPPQGGGPSTSQTIANMTGSPTSGAMSNDPAATYAGTTAPGPGGYQWGPGMFAPTGTSGTGQYVHDGQWTTVQPQNNGVVVRPNVNVGGSP